MNGTDIFPQARDHALIKSPQSAHSWGGRTRYSVTLPPQNTLQLLSFFDCILLCTTVCTRSCVLSYCCVFQAGKHKAWLAANSGGASLSLSAQWNLCRGTRKVFVGERFSFCCERFSRQLLLLSKSPVALLYSVAVALSLFSGWWLCCKGGGFTVEGGQTGGKRHADPASFSFSLHPFFFLSSPNCSSFFSGNIFCFGYSFSVQIVTLSLPVFSFSILYIFLLPPPTPPSSNATSINSFIISRLQSLGRRDGFLENWRHFEPLCKAHFQPLLLWCNLMVTQENAQTHNALQSYRKAQNMIYLSKKWPWYYRVIIFWLVLP